MQLSSVNYIFRVRLKCARPIAEMGHQWGLALCERKKLCGRNYCCQSASPVGYAARARALLAATPGEVTSLYRVLPHTPSPPTTRVAPRAVGSDTRATDRVTHAVTHHISIGAELNFAAAWRGGVPRTQLSKRGK